MSVYDGAFDVEDVGVVFQSSLEKLSLLTQLGNVGSVIVSEQLVPKNSVCYLESYYQTCRQWNREWLDQLVYRLLHYYF